jgi:hypothetical protein
MLDDDRDMQERHDRIASWGGMPTAPDDIAYLFETLRLAIDRVEDRLLPEHSWGLSDADRAEAEELLDGLRESYDDIFLQSIGIK